MPKIPMHERKRQATLKRGIKYYEQEKRHAERAFKRAVKGEMIGSSHYDRCHKTFLLLLRAADIEIKCLQGQLPPFVVWNAKGDYLEMRPVD